MFRLYKNDEKMTIYISWNFYLYIIQTSGKFLKFLILRKEKEMINNDEFSKRYICSYGKLHGKTEGENICSCSSSEIKYVCNATKKIPLITFLKILPNKNDIEIRSSGAKKFIENISSDEKEHGKYIIRLIDQYGAKVLFRNVSELRIKEIKENEIYSIVLCLEDEISNQHIHHISNYLYYDDIVNLLTLNVNYKVNSGDIIVEKIDYNTKSRKLDIDCIDKKIHTKKKKLYTEDLVIFVYNEYVDYYHSLSDKEKSIITEKDFNQLIIIAPACVYYTQIFIIPFENIVNWMIYDINNNCHIKDHNLSFKNTILVKLKNFVGSSNLNHLKSNMNISLNADKEKEMDFIERYSCSCGILQGKTEEDHICNSCFDEVKCIPDTIALITFLKVVKSTSTIDVHDSQTRHFIGRILAHEENDNGKYLLEFVNVFNGEILFRKIKNIKIICNGSKSNTIIVFVDEPEINQILPRIKKYIQSNEFSTLYKTDMVFTINDCESFVKTVKLDDDHQLNLDYTINKNHMPINNNQISAEDMLITAYNRYVDTYGFKVNEYEKRINQLIKFSLEQHSSSKKIGGELSLELFLKSVDSFLLDTYSNIKRTDNISFEESENNSKQIISSIKEATEKKSLSENDDNQKEKQDIKILSDIDEKSNHDNNDLHVSPDLKEILNLFKNRNNTIPNSINDNVPLGLVLSMVEDCQLNENIKIKVYQGDKLIFNYKAKDNTDTFSSFLQYECFNVVSIYSFKDYLINEVIDTIVINIDNTYIDYLTPLNLTIKKLTLITIRDQNKMMLNFMNESDIYDQYIKYITITHGKIRMGYFRDKNFKEECNLINKHLIFLQLYQIYCEYLNRLDFYSDQYKNIYVSDTIKLMLLFEIEYGYTDLTESNFEEFVLSLEERRTLGLQPSTVIK